LDIFGYTGFSPDDQAVIVAFRSAVSIQNWVVNFDATQVFTVIARYLTQDALGAKFTKVSITPLPELRDTLEPKSRNFYLFTETPRYM